MTGRSPSLPSRTRLLRVVVALLGVLWAEAAIVCALGSGRPVIGIMPGGSIDVASVAATAVGAAAIVVLVLSGSLVTSVALWSRGDPEDAHRRPRWRSSCGALFVLGCLAVAWWHLTWWTVLASHVDRVAPPPWDTALVVALLLALWWPWAPTPAAILHEGLGVTDGLRRSMELCRSSPGAAMGWYVVVAVALSAVITGTTHLLASHPQTALFACAVAFLAASAGHAVVYDDLAARAGNGRAPAGRPRRNIPAA